MSASLFLITIGIALIAAAVAPMIQGKFRPVPFWFVIGAGVVSIVLGGLWPLFPTPQPGTLRDSVQSAANDFRWWFAVITAMWLHQVISGLLSELKRNNEIVALRNDVQAIANVIERGVMPRHLTRRQHASLVGFLKQQSEPHPVVLRVLAGDAEADGFRADIHQALEKAGWTIAKIEQATDIPEGLRINITRTQADAMAANNAKGSTYLYHPDRVLQHAFAAAGVRVDGTGGGSGVNVTETVLAVEIGRNRRDSYAVDPPLGIWP